MNVENGKKTETISIQRLLYRAKVPLSLSLLSSALERKSLVRIYSCVVSYVRAQSNARHPTVGF